MSDKEYISTLHLPKTDFQMKANLPNKEPKYIKKWTEEKIYEKGLEKNKNGETFILHDGPPYANGNTHIGHALNKILKDIILKYKTFRGFRSPYVPGWDTHGLPIELQVVKEVGVAKAREMSTLEIRKLCEKYARKWVGIQKEQFIRLGVLGDWDNPYLTLDPRFEAKQLELFGEIYENGYIFKGLKPVYWSPATETALAEAEIEYYDHVSPSIYVRMQANKDLLDKIGFNEDAYVLIWTTTPWTLPANVAICLNENFDYGLYKTEKGNLILAKDLAESAFKDIGIENFELIKEFKGKDLEYTTYKHPFLERTGLVILGDHVTADAGTGAVHTAPGHGQDDYVVGLNYKIPVISPIDHRGCLTEEAGDLFKGLFYSDANKAIIKHLTETGHILKTQEISHSYPHDWRSKTPVIFRATEQWFIRMEGGDLREKTLKAIDKINFIPSWGKNRIGSMMETRPDWCISRQRVWGVPIPIFYNDETNEEIFHKEILDRICDLVRENGSNIWVEKSPEELIGEELLVKYNLKDLKLRKETNIMDVWFDSGSSHRGVLEVWKGLRRPADLYLEGSDQHRGWFHTSLLTSVASTGDSPYKNVLTHGFVNDGEGRKMSKSLGNTVSPADVIKVYGADILRLWCGSVDYRDDVRISDNIVKQMSEAYRRIRNTARYILGNSYDFNPKTDKVAYKDMLEIDKWALNKLEVLKRNVTESYDKYEFYNLFQGIHYFAAIDMSAFYLDIIKDRLYTEKKDSVVRRAAQTVMYEVLMTLTKMVAPILSFTAEEIWESLPAETREAESIFLADWYVNSDEYLKPELDEKWQQIIKLRKEVNKKLEKARQGENKIIGNSLDAKVSLYTEDNTLKEFIKENLELLETVFIVSDLEVVDSADENFTDAEEIEKLTIKITHADGEKCERCWKYDELGSDSEHPTLCPRCAAVLK
ncbi:isoleucine--tRNA ligase [Fusobacterium nucleatum]|uniref:Isoleucine--tRNA ligase n=1 Tax=Fusobacterium nucleatum TaxID=851 RepID=A0AAX3MBG7_FUSNU|nr:isoleucine--tRNA ligase [Fusobacterium nucleatum]WDA44085.1 isoleucine--tRNA ligase [Fusobacterium nucleatum]